MLRRVLVALLVAFLAVGILPQSSYGHWDLPGPPPITTSVVVGSVTITGGYADWSDWELLLLVNAELAGHAGVKVSKSFYNDTHSRILPSWSITTSLIRHDECSPPGVPNLEVQLIELDSTAAEKAATVIAAGAAIKIASASTGPVGGVIAFVVGGVIVYLINSDGADDIGSGQGNILMPHNPNDPAGRLTLNLRGQDGSATFEAYGYTTALTDTGQCSVTPVSDPPPTPHQRATAIYTPLHDSFLLAPIQEEEPGNPSDLTPERVLAIRLTYDRLAIGVAEIVAGAEIQDASSYQGVASAIQHFATAQQAVAEGQYLTAVDEYKAAYLAAAMARENAIPTTTTLLPFQISTITDFYSTKQLRRFTIPATVLGSQSGSQVQLTNAPNGMGVRITHPDTTVNVFNIGIDTGTVPPGTYQLQLTATSGANQTTSILTVVVNGLDNCPNLNNQDQSDLDSDGIGDACDTCPSLFNGVDVDFDHIPNDADNCPDVFNPDQAGHCVYASGGLPGSCQNDSDCTTGTFGACDKSRGFACSGLTSDLDGDGRVDRNDNCVLAWNPSQQDTDADGLGDVCDADCTGAILVHICTNSPATPCTGDVDCPAGGYCQAAVRNTGGCSVYNADADVDGVPDTVDNCACVYNPPVTPDGLDQLDSDSDGLGDACDNCPFVPNPGQADVNGNGIGDVCDCASDTDLDGRTDCQDNCPGVANPNQADLDLDGIGDPCDPDIDGDGRDNSADCSPTDAGVFAVPGDVPLQVVHDTTSDTTTLLWTTVNDGGWNTQHDIVRGTIGEWPIGNGASEACIALNVPPSWFNQTDYSQDSALGKAYWYLIRGKNSCGVGTYGTASDGTPRTTAACP